jgi:hypothetical protein
VVGQPASKKQPNGGKKHEPSLASFVDDAMALQRWSVTVGPARGLRLRR